MFPFCSIVRQQQAAVKGKGICPRSHMGGDHHNNNIHCNTVTYTVLCCVVVTLTVTTVGGLVFVCLCILVCVERERIITPLTLMSK